MLLNVHGRALHSPQHYHRSRVPRMLNRLIPERKQISRKTEKERKYGANNDNKKKTRRKKKKKNTKHKKNGKVCVASIDGSID